MFKEPLVSAISNSTFECRLREISGLSLHIKAQMHDCLIFVLTQRVADERFEHLNAFHVLLLVLK